MKSFMNFTHHNPSIDRKHEGMGGACDTYGKEEKCMQGFGGEK
jgi:hypothetical protein